MADTCPTCGAAVRVVSTDEGTSHYELTRSEAQDTAASSGLRDDDEALDALLAAWFTARADAIRDVAAHRASPPEYPGMALVPIADLDRLAAYVELPKDRAALANPTPEPSLRDALAAALDKLQVVKRRGGVNAGPYVASPPITADMLLTALPGLSLSAQPSKQASSPSTSAEPLPDRCIVCPHGRDDHYVRGADEMNWCRPCNAGDMFGPCSNYYIPIHTFEPTPPITQDMCRYPGCNLPEDMNAHRAEYRAN